LATAVKCRFCQEWLIQKRSGGLEALVGDLTGVSFGHYTITGHIGDGGMGSVWKGRHNTLDRVVAVKVLHGQMLSHTEIVKRFLTEARAVVRLGSPHLVEILDLGVLPDGRPYYVMELLEGITLDAWMQKGPVAHNDLLSIGEQLLAALSVVHEKQIIHRDLKPANVMLVEPAEGGLQLKLLDFGVAKCFDEALADEIGLTRTGMTVGTPVYMSPEQAGGQRDIDARSDLYSAGVLLYHVATGTPPFLDENALTIMEMHRSTRPRPARSLRDDLHPGLDAWLAKMLAKRREARFATAAEARAALLSIPAPSVAAVGRFPKHGRAWAAGLSLAATLPVVAWLWPSASPVPDAPTNKTPPREVSAPLPEAAPPVPALVPVPLTESPLETVSSPEPSSKRPRTLRPREATRTNAASSVTSRPGGPPGAERLVVPYVKEPKK
jgi:serine/threonine-protein kinase